MRKILSDLKAVRLVFALCGSTRHKIRTYDYIVNGSVGAIVDLVDLRAYKE